MLELVVGVEPEAEEDHSALLAFRERRIVARVVLVVLGVAREGRNPLKGRDRLGHAVERHVGAKDLLELLACSQGSPVAGRRPAGDSGLPISTGLVIGPWACPSSDGARPSQNIVLP